MFLPLDFDGEVYLIQISSRAEEVSRKSKEEQLKYETSIRKCCIFRLRIFIQSFFHIIFLRKMKKRCHIFKNKGYGNRFTNNHSHKKNRFRMIDIFSKQRNNFPPSATIYVQPPITLHPKLLSNFLKPD